MAEIDLKAYTSQAMELETAIYTQKKLMAAHKTLLENQAPIEPQRRKVEEPQKPQRPAPSTYQANAGFHFCIVLMIIAGILGLLALFAGAIIRALIAIAMGVGGVASAYSEITEKRDQEHYAQLRYERYQKDLAEYPNLMAQYKKDLATANNEYDQAMAVYNEALANNQLDIRINMEKHQSVLAELETALQELYNQDIVFPKYRNMVAITTISEYLMSGRCFELEGPNGAYNLYEMELRQNIIIGQLSSIITNIEQIRNSQFYLYRELIRSNDMVGEILGEIKQVNQNTKLTAYFTEVSAKIAAAPKRYYGRVYIH